MTKIAYITSGKTGLHSFTFRELELLQENNINFVLCFTQFNNGLFMPLKTWDFIVFDKTSFFISLFVFVFSKPIKFYKLLIESAKNNSVKYFIIAIYFYYKLYRNLLLIFQYFLYYHLQQIFYSYLLF